MDKQVKSPLAETTERTAASQSSLALSGGPQWMLMWVLSRVSTLELLEVRHPYLHDCENKAQSKQLGGEETKDFFK